MSLVFERIFTEGIAVLSYLIGDDGTGTAAVIDPTTDVDRLVTLARRHQVAITHVFETHVHADFVSGARALVSRVPSARLLVSHEGGTKYGEGFGRVRPGQTFAFGRTVLEAHPTPGHTPEHMSYIVAEKEHRDFPWAVFTGDSLFVNSVGRPDLLGRAQAARLTRQLFDTLQAFYLHLRDDVIIYPAHGEGSPCGANIGDRIESTIGYERRFNPFLQQAEFARFAQRLKNDAPPIPAYYPRMKTLNAMRPMKETAPPVPALPVPAFRQALRARRARLVDTRTMLAFGGGHIPGALNIGAGPMLPIWAGWLLDPAKPLLLVVDDDSEVEHVAQLFARTGFTRFAGYLAGGMKAWVGEGEPLAAVGQITVRELHRNQARFQIVDVRSPSEWREGHVPGAHHIFLPELPRRAKGLAKHRRVAVYCDSGYRASIGGSLLRQQGFTDIYNVPGSWQAWQSAGLPVEAD